MYVKTTKGLTRSSSSGEEVRKVVPESYQDRVSEFLGELENVVNKATLLDFTSNGILYNEERAKAGPCKCFEYEIRGEKRLFCWAPGIIGALSKEQIEKYCPPEKRVMKPREEIPKRFSKFIEASEACKGLPLPERLECMSREAERRGIKI